MAAQVVTSENLKDFNAAKLGLTREPAKPAPEEPKADPKAEAKPAAEQKPPDPADKAEAERVATEKHKNGFEKRLGQLTRERDDARREAQEAREAAEAARKAAEPVKGREKPIAANFKDAFDFAEALADWKLEEKWRQKEEAERKELGRLQAERVMKTWTASVRKTAAEIPDYNEVIAAATIPLTNELRDAILESEIGPRVQYYLAKNPEEVERLTAMTVRGMERAFGKLEAMIEDDMAKHQTKSEDALPAVKIPKRTQQAPEPITPLAGTAVAGTNGIVDADGNVVGSYKDYKAARKAGKIK